MVYHSLIMLVSNFYSVYIDESSSNECSPKLCSITTYITDEAHSLQASQVAS
jgi:hypothetical protein